MELERWPLDWTVALRAGESPVSLFDLVELRSVVDTLRVAAGLPPVAWVGQSDDDPTLVAGRTPIRAVHFTQLRQAIAELFDAAELGPLPGFRAGAIVPGERVIKLSDLLDLRGWTEQYEALAPDRAARVVRRYGAYSRPELDAEPAAGEYTRGKLTELWDGAGFSRYFYDDCGRRTRELRVLDGQEYWSGYEHDAAGRVTALVYPDGERVACQSDPADEASGLARFAGSSWGSLLGESVGPVQTGEEALAEALGRSGERLVKRDGRGRPVRLGNPARPALRLAYPGEGRLVKRVDEAGTLHLVGPHYEREPGGGPGGVERVRYRDVCQGLRVAGKAS